MRDLRANLRFQDPATQQTERRVDLQGEQHEPDQTQEQPDLVRRNQEFEQRSYDRHQSRIETEQL